MKGLLKFLALDFYWELFFYIIPTCILTYYAIEPIKTTVNEKWISWANENWPFILRNAIWLHAFASIATLALPLIGKKVSLKVKNQSEISELINLRDSLRVLELTNQVFSDAVLAKSNRFSDIYKKLKLNQIGKTANSVFKSITQPAVQIEKLSNGLVHIFRSINNSDDIKMTTILCYENQMQEFLFMSDHSPKFNLNNLKNSSMAKKCINDNISYIIEDTANCVDFDFDKQTSRIGSIYCFPIAQSGEQQFVICFTSQKAHDLSVRKKDEYDEILKNFENRFILEWYLNQIKIKIA
ncbi:MAG: hypothetical protein IT264_00075 [Saprospiraceae bacterium]|nr:hypothetical protein [Saprospiraceae bacterium]